MPLPVERIESRILVVRGHRVMLDADLAELYGVTTGALNQAVKRNVERFPEDFMFRLTPEEAEKVRSQTVTGSTLKSQSVISNGRGGRRRALPAAFTEQGVSMLSSVLRSKRAVQVNISIMRAFVRLRGMLASHVDLTRKLEVLERKYAVHDEQIKAIFDAIRALMEPPKTPRRKIGF